MKDFAVFKTQNGFLLRYFYDLGEGPTLEESDSNAIVFECIDTLCVWVSRHFAAIEAAEMMAAKETKGNE